MQLSHDTLDQMLEIFHPSSTRAYTSSHFHETVSMPYIAPHFRTVYAFDIDT